MRDVTPAVKLTKSQIRILAALADRYEAAREPVALSVREAADLLWISRSTFQIAISVLADEDFIRIRPGNRVEPSRYEVTETGVAELSRRVPISGSRRGGPISDGGVPNSGSERGPISIGRVPISSSAYIGNARRITHSLTTDTATKNVRVSECNGAAQIRAKFREVGFALAFNDPIPNRLAARGAAHGLMPETVCLLIQRKVDEKRRQRYRVAHAGALEMFVNGEIDRVPLARKPAASETRPLDEIRSPQDSIEDRIAFKERFLAEFPNYPQASVIRRQLEELLAVRDGSAGMAAAAGRAS